MDKLLIEKNKRLQKSLYSIDLKYKKIIEKGSLFKRKQRDIDKAKRKNEIWYKTTVKKERAKSKGKVLKKKVNYLQMYDTIYAIYTVLKGSWRSGNSIVNNCLSCGNMIEVGHLENKLFIRNPNCQNGHYIPRSQSKALVYYDNNTWCQCGHCNGNLHGNVAEYRKALCFTIGEDEVELMEEIKKQKNYTAGLPKDKYSEQWVPLIIDIRDRVLKRICSLYIKSDIVIDTKKQINKKILSLQPL